MVESKQIIVSTDASGAVQAAKAGFVVMIVDVIDMSTTLESALDAGACAVLGASPDYTRAPVKLNPEEMGRRAAIRARETGHGIILVAEPRVGTDQERLSRCQKVLKGIEMENGSIEAIVPNIGAEVPRLTDMNGRVVLAVSDTGGVAYDAASIYSDQVITGTVARTLKQKGPQPAMTAVERAVAMLKPENPGIAVVAASRNSLEDVLAAEWIASLLLHA